MKEEEEDDNGNDSDRREKEEENVEGGTICKAKPNQVVAIAITKNVPDSPEETKRENWESRGSGVFGQAHNIIPTSKLQVQLQLQLKYKIQQRK